MRSISIFLCFDYEYTIFYSSVSRDLARNFVSTEDELFDTT